MLQNPHIYDRHTGSLWQNLKFFQFFVFGWSLTCNTWRWYKFARHYCYYYLLLLLILYMHLERESIPSCSRAYKISWPRYRRIAAQTALHSNTGNWKEDHYYYLHGTWQWLMHKHATSLSATSLNLRARRLQDLLPIEDWSNMFWNNPYSLVLSHMTVDTHGSHTTHEGTHTHTHTHNNTSHTHTQVTHTHTHTFTLHTHTLSSFSTDTCTHTFTGTFTHDTHTHTHF